MRERVNPTGTYTIHTLAARVTALEENQRTLEMHIRQHAEKIWPIADSSTTPPTVAEPAANDPVGPLDKIIEVGRAAGFDIRSNTNPPSGGLTVYGLVKEMADKLAALRLALGMEIE